MNALDEFIEKINKAKAVGFVKNHEHNMSAKLMYIMLTSNGFSCALLSDRYLYIKGSFYEFYNQQSVDRIYNKKVLEEELDYCIVEVSLKNIQQKLFERLKLSGAVFTGLEKSTENKGLDFQTQRDTLKSFLDQLPKQSFVLTNIDDKNGEFMMQNTKAKEYSYSQKRMADFKIKILEKNYFGSRLTLDGEEVWATTKYESECLELLCVYATARLLGIEKTDSLVFLSSMTSKQGSIVLELDKKLNFVRT